ncbi:FixH family protein [Bacillus sp. AK128]
MFKKIFFILAMVMTALVGCSGAGEGNLNENQSNMAVLEVHLTVNPENPEVNEEVTFKAHVTQGEENVEDANEVMFEIIESGQDTSEMVEGDYLGEGVYSIEKNFLHEGKYFVVAHVTARDMHTMPRVEFHVGSQEVEASEEESNEGSHNH